MSSSNTSPKGEKVASSPQDASKSTYSGEKRQRTLEDMFGTRNSKQGPATKKAKTGPNDSRSTTMNQFFSTSKTLDSITFSPSEFQESLSDEDKKLLQLEIEVFGTSWFTVLHGEFKKPYFLALKRFLWDLGVQGVDTPHTVQVFPPAKQIYSWSDTPLGNVKCVILGQDPYHAAGQAQGLCFSVPKGVRVPPSLINIYKELKSNYPEFEIPKHGDLSTWAHKGVLMLNTCLTVNAGKAGSHSEKGWEKFTQEVIHVVDKWGGANVPSGGKTAGSGVGQGVVFLCWGSWAAKRVTTLSKTKHLILTSPHPSPLSAHRGFFGNNHFKLANDWLEKKYGLAGTVDWCGLDTPKAPLVA